MRVSSGDRPAHHGLPVGQTQQEAVVGADGRAVVLEEAAAGALADGAGPSEGAVGREVQLAGVVDDEDGPLGIHLPAGEDVMAGQEGVGGGFGSVHQGVEPPRLVPVELGGQGALRAQGEAGGGADEAVAPGGGARRTEVGRGPGTGVGV